MQRALLQFNRPENAGMVREALKKCGREDLIGYGEGCLVKPQRGTQGGHNGSAPSYRDDRRGGRDKRGGAKSAAKPAKSARSRADKKKPANKTRRHGAS